MPSQKKPGGIGHLVVAATVLLGQDCRRSGTAPEALSPSPLQIRTLSSGRQIKVAGVDNVNGNTLFFSYVPDLGIDDREALRPEVEDIWKDVRQEAEKADAKEVIIEARTGSHHAKIAALLSIVFVYRRDPNGAWIGPRGT
jgi:hypothetical protein